jgi:hypothetical protein
MLLLADANGAGNPMFDRLFLIYFCIGYATYLYFVVSWFVWKFFSFPKASWRDFFVKLVLWHLLLAIWPMWWIAWFQQLREDRLALQTKDDCIG